MQTPYDHFGPLFEAVQSAGLFADSKTFADAVPRRETSAIMADYVAGNFASPTALRKFVDANFEVPEDPLAASSGKTGVPITDHIRDLWPLLTRPSIDAEDGSSALTLPDSYVVPGGRFREIYYWDSYFTMLGLKADGRSDLVESMLADFVSLVERFGHVPNGARSYYVGRSQPPFLYLMLDLSEASDPLLEKRRFAALRQEHAFWMAPERSVSMPDGAVLNRYAGGSDLPREESWREDVAVARSSDRAADGLFRDIRAGAESGWDFSSRWFADGKSLATIETTNIVPVDLNSLLYGLEIAIRDRSTIDDDASATEFADRAEKRRAAVERWLWNEEDERYEDWDIEGERRRSTLTAATAFPLFTGLAMPARARGVVRTMERQLLAPGGLRTTLVDTGEQWDAPNGWAPLQWIASDGALRVGEARFAREIGQRFLATVEREYKASGRLLEKYDVERQTAGGGGEYPTQDGFGWTNGVARALTERFCL